MSRKKGLEQKEIIDNFDLGGEEIAGNLDEIEKVNKKLGGYSVLLSAIEKVVSHFSLQKTTLTLMDVGSGGGDGLREIAKMAREKNYDFQLKGIDANPYITAMSINNTIGYPEISYETGNYMSQEFLRQQHDLVTASLFLHHFNEEEIIHFLKTIKNTTRYAIIINDLCRSKLAYFLFSLITVIFNASEITRHDGKISILRGFKKREWKTLLQKAEISDYEIKWKWAFRHQIIVYCR